jgi:hypothetical protein
LEESGLLANAPTGRLWRTGAIKCRFMLSSSSPQEPTFDMLAQNDDFNSYAA